MRRRLRAEGIRSERHRGAILLAPGELDHFSSVGLFEGNDELYLCAEWNDEFEPFPGRITSEVQDFNITSRSGSRSGCSTSGACSRSATARAELRDTRHSAERAAAARASAGATIVSLDHSGGGVSKLFRS